MCTSSIHVYTTFSPTPSKLFTKRPAGIARARHTHTLPECCVPPSSQHTEKTTPLFMTFCTHDLGINHFFSTLHIRFGQRPFMCGWIVRPSFLEKSCSLDKSLLSFLLSCSGQKQHHQSLPHFKKGTKRQIFRCNLTQHPWSMRNQPPLPRLR